MITVPVQLAERSYDVVIGNGARELVAAMVPASAQRVAIVSQANVPLTVEVDVESHRLEIGDGEAHKSLATIELLCRGFARIGLTRADAVIAVGGGLVTDVAGFAAASWHRGVPVIHVATTLLGMVDAAIGGKTSVNLPEGKNLVGAFWQPIGVACDLDALSTLPARELRSGRGEMAKYHFLTGDDLLALDEPERIARCVAIKASFVVDDEREDGRRTLLNYGHTLAHAVEIATDHAIAHGEAVGLGLCFAAQLAHVLGRIDQAAVEHHHQVVADTYDLATRLPDGVAAADLVHLMGRDKKSMGSLTFVLGGPDGLEVVDQVSEEAVLSALDAMAARP